MLEKPSDLRHQDAENPAEPGVFPTLLETRGRILSLAAYLESIQE